MLISHTTNQFPTGYVPTVFDNYSANVLVDNKPYNLGLWETAGEEDADRLRHLSYPDTSVFLLCYSVSSRAQWEHIKTKWYPEIRLHCPGTPFLIIATKSDLANDERFLGETVSWEEGRKLAAKVGANKFMECSALTQKGLKEVFDEAIRVVLHPAPVQQRSLFSSIFSMFR
jgi:Ras-related C3 botulinum toxin substrate 1